tara:strand:- start:960 stop:1124 length:165 start_codon:yes stop_codon:yes gene_type:complete
MNSLEDLVQYSRNLILDGCNDVYESTLRLNQKLDEAEEHAKQCSQEFDDLHLEA